MKKPNFQVIKIAIVFAFALSLSFNTYSQTNSITRGPYLQSGTSTSMIVKWRTSNSTNSKVWYGTDVNSLNQTEVISEIRTDHEVTVSGLQANSIYYYAIGDSLGQKLGGNGDASFYFKTAPTIGSSQPVTAWILGDCGTASLDQELVRDAYYNYIGSSHTDMVLMLGDNAYDDGFDNEYQDAVFDIYPDKLKNSIFWSCPGNHDYFGSGLNNAYYDIFSFPKSGEAGGLASNTEKYYSFDYANMHIISLDSHDEDRSPNSPMLTWLENDLAATTQKWIVVIFHHPPYSKGSHDSDDSSENRIIEMRENVLPICESYGVDLVLSGHSHAYERSKLINGQYGFSNTYDPLFHDVDGGNGQLNGTGAYQQNAGVEGTVYVVTGSAGGVSPVGNHPVMYFSKEQLGSTILEVNGDQMDVKFLNENGVVEDSLTFVQNGQPAVNWTNPNNGNLYTNLNPIDLNVSAIDSDGSITQVEYFINGVSIGIDVDAPYSLSWTPPAFLNYLLKATATDNEGNITSKEISITFDNNPSTSIAIQISSGDDDAEEVLGVMDLTSSDLELVEDGSDEQTVGLIFKGLNIPTGANVTNAYIQFTTDESESVFTDLTIHGENTDSSSSFNSSTFNLTSRATTSTSVNWIPQTCSIIGEAGLDQQTPDLSGIVQEIIDRPGWVEDNSIGFIISGTGTRTADSYNGSSANAATLHVTFELNLCAPFFDGDSDGYCSDVDCDDTDPAINPGTAEICDGIDNNCNGQIDEGAISSFYADTDNDGFGDPNNSVQACSLPSGYVNNNLDCDDDDGSINPNTSEVCDGLDNNCDGQIDEGLSSTYYADVDNDGFGDPNNSIQACSLPSGYVTDNMDCDDSDGSINPNASEDCDGLDNNCNGQIDEGLSSNTYYADIDNDGFGDINSPLQACSVPIGYVSNNTDCDDSNGSVNLGASEICDGIDNNCDGQIDEGFINTYYSDTDNDGFGDINFPTQACLAPSGYVSDNTDCDDSNDSVYPSAIEICDGVDNNCNGQIDEGLVFNTYYADIDSDGFGDPTNSIDACSSPSGYVSDNTDCDDTDSNIYIGATCDDNNQFTINDTYDSNCICVGIPLIIPPTVNWTQPTQGQFFTNLNPITLNVEASDLDGSVTQVEYFVNGVSIGVDIVAPYSISWTPLAYGNYMLKTIATDNSGNTSSAEISILLQDISPMSIAIQVNDGDDDAEESGGSMILSSSDLEMVEDGSDDQTVGLVFDEINIPQGVVISSAYIQFTTDESESTFTNLTIHGENTDNSLSFTSSNSNLTSRPTTSASINWIPSTWSSIGEAGLNQQTPDLRIVVQEIIDRLGWGQNNSMGFIISGVGVRVAESYNGSPADAAILHVTFEINPCAPLFDLDNDGFCSDIDCDDTNPNINSSAIEICDGIDNNCDGQIDEGVLILFYADTDSDGFGDPNNTVQACSTPSGYVSDNTDCDDTNGNVNPNSLKICDDIDNDCDGQIDEDLINNTYYADTDTDSDGFGDSNSSIQDCSAPTGYVSDNTDCDDTASNIYIGASCNDSDPNTVNDIYNSNCICVGVPPIIPPTINWTNPTNGQAYTNLNSIALDVNAFDIDGSIAQVEYFVAGVSIGIDVVAPYSISWTPLAYGNFLLKATATDNVGNTSSAEISILFQDITPIDITVQINEGDDDAEESGGSMILSSSDLEMVEDGSDEQTVGLVFDGINIPSGATISNAYIQFTTDESESTFTNLTIQGEDTDNSLSFTSSNFNLTSRLTTSASVNWIPPAWSTIGEAGLDQQTPDLSTLVQEIVDRPGWVENNSLGFVISGNGTGVAESYNGSSDDAATLHITYSLNSCAPFLDVDNDGFCSDVDCDDTNATIYPGAIEICDGIDNNCDGQVDEGVLVSYFADIDNDGFGDPNNSVQDCSPPSGYVFNNTDCDDTNATVYATAIEICDGIDNNCDGQIDEGLINTYHADTDSDGFGDPNNSIQGCSAPQGYVINNTDCDDNDLAVNPNATEVCDGIDNNCDGQIDEGLNNTYYADTDNDGFGDPNNSIQACIIPSGYVSDNTDCDDSNGNINPGVSEICDGIDNNCDGQIDEGLSNNTYYADTDNDGFGDPNNSVQDCSIPSGYVIDNTDCDDTDPNIYIGATCDDGDPNTTNDLYDSNCICIGQPLVIPPTIIWTNPTNGQIYTNLDPIPLNVNASDSDGFITQVEYYVNNTSIGIDLVTPYSINWTPLAYGSYLLKTTATDNDGNISSEEISIVIQDITPSIITVQINDGDDDAEESGGSMILSSSDLEMVEDGSDEQTVGLVFDELNIPSGATITNAYIQFTTDESESTSTNLTIHGEDSDNSLSFTTSNFNLTSRPTTLASVNWIPPGWSSISEAGINQQTPDLSTLVQEIVDRPGWVENNSMGFIISGDGKRVAESYNGSPEDAATLHFTFEMSAGSSSFIIPNNKYKDFIAKSKEHINSEVKQKKNSLYFFPNPVSDQLTIQYEMYNDQTTYVELIDLNGKQVITKNIQMTKGNNEFHLDLRKAPSGLYFLRLVEGEYQLLEKVVINR